MEEYGQKIQDVSLIVTRCVCGVLVVAALVILVLSLSKSKHRKYAEENAYSNTVTLTVSNPSK